MMSQEAVGEPSSRSPRANRGSPNASPLDSGEGALESRPPRSSSTERARQLLQNLSRDNAAVEVTADLISDRFSIGFENLSEIGQRNILGALSLLQSHLERRSVRFGARVIPTDQMQRFRTGAYLDVEILRTMRLSGKLESLRINYLRNIEEYGSEAVAHLCPAEGTLLKLRRAGVATVGLLERILVTDTKIHQLSRQERSSLSDAYAEWQELKMQTAPDHQS